MNKTNGPIYNTLWIYGDSQARRMHSEVKNTPLCRTIFKTCKLTHNWVYKDPVRRPPNDDLDLNQTRVLSEINGVLDLPEMSENSVMVLNLGYHYLQAISFSKFVELLQKVVEMFKNRERDGRKTAKMIWKTTMSLSKEKDVKDMLYVDFKRFLSNPVSFLGVGKKSVYIKPQ